MATRRRIFFSFPYEADNWRAARVRNMGIVEGNAPVSNNDWEEIAQGGDAAIGEWIDVQLAGKSRAVVLIGGSTAGRKWINYEIEKAWNDRRGLLGIHVHNLADSSGKRSQKGDNRFEFFAVGGRMLSGIVKAHAPPYSTSTWVHSHIKQNIADWVEEGIEIRRAHS